MEIPYREIGRDQAAVEEHRKDEEERDQPAAHQIAAGQRVRCGYIHKQADQRAHQRIQNCVQIAGPDIVVPEQLLIAVQRELAGPEPYVAVRHLGRVAERRDDDKIQRVGDRQQNDAAQRIQEYDVNLPIYEGTSDDVLVKGVGHLEGSSYPLGGAGTHSVLTGHRGLAEAVLFTDLDKLGEGDRFYLHIMDEVLAYQVDQVKVVEPENTEDLEIIPGGE